MVLPLTSQHTKLDHSLVEASYDLGAKKDKNIYQSHTPDDAPGNICRNDTGIHTEPWSILHIGCHGRRQRAYLGNLIQNQFLVARNWPLGAAFSVLLIIFTLVVLKAYSKVGDLDDLA